MAGYTKLFSDIITSSVWNEDDKTRIVWITLLALTTDSSGFVHCALPSLALMARVSQEDCQQAINKLENTDFFSRTPDHDGRRIKKTEGGWIILNYEKHRNRLSNDADAVYHREYMRKYREKKESSQKLMCINPASASDIKSSLKGDIKGELPDSLKTPEFQTAWKNWQKHRMEIKKKLTPSCAAMQLKEFESWGIPRAIQAIEYTIKKGWQGIKEPEENNQPKIITQSQPDKKSFEQIRNEIIKKLNEAALAGGDAVSRCLSACHNIYSDKKIINEAYDIFKFQNKKQAGG